MNWNAFVTDEIVQIALQNALLAHQNNIVDLQNIRNVIRKLSEISAVDGASDPLSILSKLSSIARGDMTNSSPPRLVPEIVCDCHGVYGRTYSSVDDVITHLISDSVVSQLNINSGPNASEERLEQSFQDLNNISSRRKFKLNVGLGRDYFWFTPSDSAPHTADAQEAASELGLIHRLEVDTALVEITFPLESSYQIYRPTFVDAGGNRRFKQIPNGPGNKVTGKGFAADLEKIHPNRSIDSSELDGGQEFVMKSVDIAQMPGVIFRYAGRTRADANAHYQSDSLFLDLLQYSGNDKLEVLNPFS